MDDLVALGGGGMRRSLNILQVCVGPIDPTCVGIVDLKPHCCGEVGEKGIPAGWLGGMET